MDQDEILRTASTADSLHPLHRNPFSCLGAETCGRTERRDPNIMCSHMQAYFLQQMHKNLRSSMNRISTLTSFSRYSGSRVAQSV
jgi:hypothetical protein